MKLIQLEMPLIAVLAGIVLVVAEQSGSSQLPPCNNDCHKVKEVCNRIPNDSCMKHDDETCDFCTGSNAACATNPKAGSCANAGFTNLTGYSSCDKICTTNLTDAIMSGTATAHAVGPLHDVPVIALFVTGTAAIVPWLGASLCERTRFRFDRGDLRRH